MRQFEIHVRLLLESDVGTAGRARLALGAVPFRAVTRADLDAVFRARLDAVNAALAAAWQVAAQRADNRDVPADLRNRDTRRSQHQGWACRPEPIQGARAPSV